MIAYIIHQLPPEQSVSKSERQVMFSHLFHQYMNAENSRMSVCEEGADVDGGVGPDMGMEMDGRHHE